MSARVPARLFFLGVYVLPGAAMADGLVIPGLGPSDAGYPRPSYRQSYNDYPTPQHDLIGRTLPPQPIDARPTYRQTYNDYPPPAGRYGGGLVEYFMTGGRPAPVAAPGYAAGPTYAPAPSYGVVSANPARAHLPQSRLPDYAPQPPAYYGAYSAYAAPQQVVYGAPAGGGSYDPVAADPGILSRTPNPIYAKQLVAYAGRERPGTIIIDTPQKFLYLVQSNGQAIRYGIGVGRPGFAWSGVKKISRKAEWPDWTPPSEMLARRPDLPRHMAGGEANPLGARALYLGSSLYRIHGTNEPYTIGTNVSSGCIRMMNNDVVDLHGRVGVGTRVIVL